MTLRQTLIAVAIAATMTGATAAGQTTAAAPSEEVKRALERGVIAAEQKEWKLAIRYFFEAFEASAKRDPTGSTLYPPVALNLGLAHARAGNEIPAIYWFYAYLALAPHVPDAPTVQQEITKLEVARDAKAARLLDEALAGIRQQTFTKHVHANEALLLNVANAQAAAGDMNAALKTLSEADGARARSRAEGFKNSPKLFPASDASVDDYVFVSYAGQQAVHGDIQFAAQVLQKVRKPSQAIASDGSPFVTADEKPIGGKDKRAMDAFWEDAISRVVEGLEEDWVQTARKSNSDFWCAAHDFDRAALLVQQISDPKRKEQAIRVIQSLRAGGCRAAVASTWLALAELSSKNKFLTDLPATLAASSECFLQLPKERVSCELPLAAQVLASRAFDQERVRIRLAQPPPLMIGVGAQLQTKDGGVFVAAVDAGGPADRAGVKVGDRIVQVDGFEARTADQVVSLVRGKAGTEVTLWVSRPGSATPLQINIIRGVLKPQ